MDRTPRARGRAVGPDLPHASTPLLLGIAFEEDGVYYGVCLNRYLMTVAPSLEEVEDAIVEMLDAHVEACEELGQVPFEGLPEAPLEYWRLWLAWTGKGAPIKTLESPPGQHRPSLQIATGQKAA
jgi:predicted RNase H-like HicB family nuclease